MFSEDKVTEIFYLADEFCKFFNAQQEKSILGTPKDGVKNNLKNSLMSVADKICLRKRVLIETCRSYFH